MSSATVEDYLKLPYHVEVIRDDSDGAPGWVARVVELPGCLTQADSFAELGEMVEDAMRAWISTALEDGQPIPEPYADETYSGKFVVRVPRSLHRQLAEVAEREGVSLNQYINVALAGAVGKFVVVQAKAAQPETPEAAWPGLSAAARRALQAAGLGGETAEQDERLFAAWLSRQLAECERNYTEGYYKDAMRGLEAMKAHLEHYAERSPLLEAFVQLSGLADCAFDKTIRLQQGVLQEIQIRTQIRKEIPQAYFHSALVAIHEERQEYSRATTHPEAGLAEVLFEHVTTGRQTDDW